MVLVTQDCMIIILFRCCTLNLVPQLQSRSMTVNGWVFMISVGFNAAARCVIHAWLWPIWLVCQFMRAF
jgi:hypothetical protein